MEPHRGGSRAIEVALVFEHRFAFYYWLRWRHDLQAEAPPDLVTIDWHDDVGDTCDFNARTLASLNVADPNELALFCWLGLRSLNDGHIAPALYLNALGDVHALIKQDWQPGIPARERGYEIVDREGQPHVINYHRRALSCRRALKGNDSPGPIVLDLDLDYFTRDHPSGDRFRQIRLSDHAIEALLDTTRPFMAQLLPRVVGMTIALEPGYCGGIHNSLAILDVVCRTLFSGARCSRLAKW